MVCSKHRQYAQCSLAENSSTESRAVRGRAMAPPRTLETRSQGRGFLLVNLRPTTDAVFTLVTYVHFVDK